MSDFKFEELVNKADPFKIQNLFNAILKYCQNNNAVLTEDLVYDFLCSYGLKSIDKENNVSKDINYLFVKWSKKVFSKFHPKKNINYYLFPDKEFCGFKSYKQEISNKEWVKLYIAIDYNHINKAVNELINFLNSKVDYIYDMKVARKMRSDSIVIRVKNKEQVKGVLNFVNNNSIIQDGLNVPNPFMPSINKIGVVKDWGGSYNDFIAGIVCDFLKQSEDISYGAFINYLKKMPPHWQYLKMMENFFGYKSEYKEAKKEDVIKTDIEILNQKIECLFQASYRTLAKYEMNGFQFGIKQLKVALVKLLENGDYGYFTNDNNVRVNLQQMISPKELLDIMRLSVNGISNDKIELLLNTYVNDIYDYYKKSNSIQLN